MSELADSELQGKVLCIEDHEVNMILVEELLRQYPGVTMVKAATGWEGVRLAREERPDLVLLDMHLPDIDGMELLRHLQADEATAGIPVVVVSADALPAQVEAARAAGAAGYLTKPVSVVELLAVVDAVLEQLETRLG